MNLLKQLEQKQTGEWLAIAVLLVTMPFTGDNVLPLIGRRCIATFSSSWLVPWGVDIIGTLNKRNYHYEL